MQTALVDPDVTPFDHLERRIGDRLDLRQAAPADETELIDALDGVSVLFTTSRFPVTRRVLAATDLDLVAKFGTGIDNVDLDAASDEGVAVTYTPGVNALAVAEHTLTLILAVARRVTRYQSLLQAGNWRDDASLGTQVTGSTVGIVGFGNVGSRLARLLTGFDATVLAYDPYVSEEDTELLGTELVDLDRLLAESDFVTVNAELTPETRHLLGREEFDAMRSSAVIVNAARGPIVDTEALATVLESGGLAGAGLDVFETEPLPPSSPFHDLDNVVTTPHAAALTTETHERVIDRLARDARTVLDGGEVPERYVAVPPQ